MIHRFIGAIPNESSQTAACNRLHTIEQRLARWPTQGSDRIQSDIMPMTHDFLSTLLGAHRTGVTGTASSLQRSGLIRYRRGQVRIVDRLTFEAMASTIEVGMIEYERMVGAGALLGDKTSANQVIVQMPGTALRMRL